MKRAKTNKTLAKRFYITRSGKIFKRKSGQDRYNAKERGITRKRKRRDWQLSADHAQVVKRIIKT